MASNYFSILITCFLMLFSIEIKAQDDKFDLEGCVFEKSNSKPISNILVEIFGTDGSTYSCNTDSLGYYSFKSKLSKRVNRYKLSFQNPGRLTEFAEIRPDTILLPSLIFNFKMNPPAPIMVDRFANYRDCTFESCSSKLSDEFSKQLLEVARTLIENPNVVLEIRGYLDAEEFKLGCSEVAKERAEQVYRFLISMGINEKRLYCSYNQNSEPLIIEYEDDTFKSGDTLDTTFISKLQTDKEKQLAQLYNRRVELNIIGTNYDSK